MRHSPTPRSGEVHVRGEPGDEAGAGARDEREGAPGGPDARAPGRRTIQISQPWLGNRGNHEDLLIFLKMFHHFTIKYNGFPLMVATDFHDSPDFPTMAGKSDMSPSEGQTRARHQEGEGDLKDPALGLDSQAPERHVLRVRMMCFVLTGRAVLVI